MSKLKFIKIEPFGRFDSKITCELYRWFRKPAIEEFVGNCTVWHQYPNGRRQTTHIESWFCDIWTADKWKRDKG